MKRALQFLLALGVFCMAAVIPDGHSKLKGFRRRLDRTNGVCAKEILDLENAIRTKR